MCGFPKTESPSYTNQIGILKNKKKFIVVVDKDTIALTDKGLAEAEMVPPAMNNQEALTKCKEQIKMGKGKLVFDLLSDGKTYSRAEIGKAIGSDHTNRSFINILGPLKTLEFIEYTTKDGEKACRMLDEVFPFGRPDEAESKSSDNEE